VKKKQRYNQIAHLESIMRLPNEGADSKTISCFLKEVPYASIFKKVHDLKNNTANED
jgi:hypothetical protein